MHEGDLQTEESLPWLRVDQLRACGRELRDCCGDIVHLVGDVVHPRASFCEESAYRGVVAEGGEELDPVGADADRRRLDSLLLDAGTVLEPAAEETLVRLHGLVEVRDGDADVMDAASVHGRDASVRVSMSRRFPLAVLLFAATLAGCGGSASNGEASKSASAILADARQAALDAGSVHMSGTIHSTSQTLSLDLILGSRGGGGTMTILGSKVDVIRAGNKAYIRAGAAFLKQAGGAAGAAVAPQLAGKWLKVPVTTSKFANVLVYTDLFSFVPQALRRVGTLTKGAEKTINGQKAIELRSSKGGSVFVATSGKPYPVEFDYGGASSGTITLRDWGTAKVPVAPKNALTVKSLGK